MEEGHDLSLFLVELTVFIRVPDLCQGPGAVGDALPVCFGVKARAVQPIMTLLASIQADLWNGDPDVDAICRMEHAN